MKIGVLLPGLQDIGGRIEKAAGMGFESCQISCFDTAALTPARAAEIRAACARCGVSVSTFWAGWSGPAVWNFTEGPVTLGLVPAVYRRRRVAELKRGADFAADLGVGQIATHMGFIPENPHDPAFPGLVDAIREVAEHCAARGLRLLFETGQETPVALMRTMECVGTDNLGLNLDTANPILYGKANPVDMLRMLGDRVFDLHAKDGLWPTDGWHLGRETPIGEGDVDFPQIIRMLRARGYDGAVTIEREIEGEQQTRDILAARDYLRRLIDDAEREA